MVLCQDDHLSLVQTRNLKERSFMRRFEKDRRVGQATLAQARLCTRKKSKFQHKNCPLHATTRCSLLKCFGLFAPGAVIFQEINWRNRGS